MATENSEEPEYRIRRKQLRQSIIYFTVLGALSVSFLFNFVRSYRRNLSLQHTHDSLLVVFTELHQTNSDLDSLIRALDENDAEALEWVARYQWHLARPGEIVFQLVPDNTLRK